MVVTEGVATYVSPTTSAVSAPNAASSAWAGTNSTNTPTGTPPPSPAPRRHAGRGRVFDRRRLLPLGVLLAALTIIALLTFGLTQWMDGGGTSAIRPTGGVTTPAAHPSVPAATATVGSVILPMGSAPPSTAASASVSPPSSSAPASMSSSPSVSPSRVPAAAVTLPALPDPARGPVAYVQGLSDQVRILLAQGPAMLQANAGQNLLTGSACCGTTSPTRFSTPETSSSAQRPTTSPPSSSRSRSTCPPVRSRPPRRICSPRELQGLAANLPVGASAGNGNANGGSANGG